MKTLVPLLLLVFSLSASAQVSEVPVATPQYGPAEGDQSRPQAASNGKDFLVAWSDSRVGSSVFATRIKGDGTVLDPMGIPVASPSFGISGSTVVAVLWCGDAYVIVLRGQDFGAGWYTAVVRVDVNGKVVDGPRLVVPEYSTAAATNGSRIMIVSEQNFVVLDDRANLIEERSLGITGAYAWTVTSNGSSFLAVAASYELVNYVRALVVDADGRILHAGTVNASTNNPLAVATSKGYDVLFDDIAKGVVTRFSMSDAGAGDLPSELLAGVNAQAVISSGNGYLVAVRGFSEKEIRIIRGSGSTVLDQSPFVTASGKDGASSPAFAANGADVLFVWNAGTYPGVDVRAVILDNTGHATSPEIDVAQSANLQEAPAIATGGRNDLVAWHETSGIYAARVTAEGIPLDGRGIFLGAGFSPEVVFDGDAYTVAWRDEDEGVQFRRLDASTGTLLGPTISITACALDVQLARDDIGVVAFIIDCRNRLVAQRIGAGGTIEPMVALTSEGVDAADVNAVYNGREWLVAWDALTLTGFIGPVPIFSTKIQAERLLESLTPVDATPVEIATSERDRIYPLVATNGGDFIVAWSYTFQSPFGQTGVYTRSVSAAGELGDPTLLVSGHDLETRSVAWDGGRYAVAYAANRGEYFATYNLMLSHVGVGDQLVISAASPDQHDVALAARPGRPLRAAYSRIAIGPVYGGVPRVFIRDLVYARRRIATH